MEVLQTRGTNVDVSESVSRRYDIVVMLDLWWSKSKVSWYGGFIVYAVVA